MIKLTQLGTTAVDINLEDYLTSDSDSILTQEWERLNFERVIEDVRVVLDNSTGIFSAAFQGKPATSVYQITVTINNVLSFVGRVKNRTITFTEKEESCAFDVFSNLKDFWDRCKGIVIQNEPATELEKIMVYATLTQILQREFLRTRIAGRQNFLDLFTNVSVDPLYSSRRIRGWADASLWPDPTIGNRGRYRELVGNRYSVPVNDNAIRNNVSGGQQRGSVTLNPSGLTTLFDLLSIFTTNYNAEFFIDYSTGTLTMHRRNQVVNLTPASGAPYDLSNIVIDDEPITLQILDDDKFDAVFYLKAIGIPPTPVLASVTYLPFPSLAGFVNDVSFVVTDFNYLGDSPPSAQLYVPVRQLLAGTLSVSLGISLYILPSTSPSAFTPPAAKRIWRTPQGGGDFYQTYVITTPLVSTTFTDNAPISNAVLISGTRLQPNVPLYQGAWLQYNEANGTWLPILIDDGKIGAPTGNLLNAMPGLRFVSPGTHTLLDFAGPDVAAFFGYEQTSEGYDDFVKQQWLSDLKSRVLIECSAEGNTYKVGDAVKSPSGVVPQAGAVSLFIKRAEVNLDPKKNTTRLSVVSQ